MFFLLSLCFLSNGKLKLKQQKRTDITELFLGAFTVQSVLEWYVIYSARVLVIPGGVSDCLPFS